MPDALDDRLEAAVSDLDLTLPPLEVVAERRRRYQRRRTRFAAAVGGVALVGMTAIGVAIVRADRDSVTTGTAEDTSSTTAPPTSTPATTTSERRGPSQSAANAARDNVIPAIAELSLGDRVRLQAETALGDGRRLVLSRLPVATIQDDRFDNCTIGDPAGVYGLDVVCTTEWAEVLLFDGDQIVKSWPLPAIPAVWVIVEADVVFVGSIGDGALPQSAVMRIDLPTLTADVVVDRYGSPGGTSLPGWRDATPEEAAIMWNAVRDADGHLLDRPSADAEQVTTSIHQPASLWVRLDALRPLFQP